MGLIRVSKFGSVDGEDVVYGLEEHSKAWTVVVPWGNSRSGKPTFEADSGVLIWNELRIYTTRMHYLDLYELAKHWKPKFIGIGFLDPESVEIMVVWEE